MKQKFKLALVDTDKASNLWIYQESLIFGKEHQGLSTKECPNKLLVALSDEPPNMGDWYLDSKNIPRQRQFLDDNLYVGDKTINASNHKEITPNTLFDNVYLESYAKDFNNGNAPEWVELVMEYFDDRDMITNEDVHKIKTTNNYVIVAEKGENKGEAKMYSKEEIIAILKLYRAFCWKNGTRVEDLTTWINHNLR